MPSFGYSTRIAAAVAALAALAALAVPTAGASELTSPCKLLSKSQLATVHVSTACTQKTLPFKQQGVTVATITEVRWGKTGVLAAGVYAVNSAYLSLARSKFDVGGPSVGVGAWSRFKGFANGKTSARVVFGVGKYIVDMVVSTPPSRPLKSRQQIVKLAAAIAGKLS